MSGGTTRDEGLRDDPEAGGPRAYRYYDFIMAAFVTVMLCSNLISAPKRVGVLGFTFGAGVLFFPISYLFGDILTEVYGYARSRRVIWAGFVAIGAASAIYTAVGLLPAAADWPYQDAYATILGQVPRFAVAGLIAFWAGEFCNSFALARLKILTQGRQLWVRTIGSTIVGQAVDTTIFATLGFWGILPPGGIWDLIRFGFVFKVSYEALATPITYAVVAFLKRAEQEDYYDVDTDFNPFRLAVETRAHEIAAAD